MKHTKRIIGGVVLLAILTIAGAGVYKRVSAAKAAADGTASDSTKANLPDVASAKQFDPNAPLPVEGAPVIQGDFVMTVNAAGQAASRRPTILRAQVGGQIRRVVVTENSAAASGQVLITIDSTDYALALAEAKARLRMAQAQFRELTLGDDQSIKDPAVRKERSDAARDRAGLETAEVEVLKAQMNLDRSTVRAPFTGRIANLKVVPGQFVNVGEELLTVQEMDPIRVDAQVLEGQIASIQPGREADVTFAAFPGEKFRGRIETVNPIVDQQTRTARVSVVVANPRGRILPGMYARVNLAADRLPNRIMVPRAAVLSRDHGRSLVFIFIPDSAGSETGRADWRYVTPGHVNDQYVEMVPDEYKGVKAGEIVLVGGHNSLTHDARIRLTKNALLSGGRPE
jgi:RND family efflux transporter MFP subunit